MRSSLLIVWEGLPLSLHCILKSHMQKPWIHIVESLSFMCPGSCSGIQSNAIQRLGCYSLRAMCGTVVTIRVHCPRWVLHFVIQIFIPKLKSDSQAHRARRYKIFCSWFVTVKSYRGTDEWNNGTNVSYVVKIQVMQVAKLAMYCMIGNSHNTSVFTRFINYNIHIHKRC